MSALPRFISSRHCIRLGCWLEVLLHRLGPSGSNSSGKPIQTREGSFPPPSLPFAWPRYHLSHLCHCWRNCQHWSSELVLRFWNCCLILRVSAISWSLYFLLVNERQYSWAEMPRKTHYRRGYQVWLIWNTWAWNHDPPMCWNSTDFPAIWMDLKITR